MFKPFAKHVWVKTEREGCEPSERTQPREGDAFEEDVNVFIFHYLPTSPLQTRYATNTTCSAVSVHPAMSPKCSRSGIECPLEEDLLLRRQSCSMTLKLSVKTTIAERNC